MAVKNPCKDILKTRQTTGLNQSQFWTRVGVTQSGGSRMENGRNISKPLRMLLTIAYGDDTEAAKTFKVLRGA